MNLSEILNQLGENRSEYLYSVAPPVFQASMFCFDSVDAMRKGLKNEMETPFYTRGYNPTVGILRKKLAALEKAEDSLVFSSGSAAIAASAISFLKSGDHVICIKKPYSWTNKLFNDLLSRFGVKTTYVDGSDSNNFKNAIQKNTHLIYLESPNSITFELQDLESIAKIAKENNIITICDNSYCTPLNQNPISLGIDIVVHSASKYLSGHSDVVAGVVCSNKKFIHQIMSKEFMTIGSIISPNDAWLILRGLRTLPLRVEKSTQTALKVVDFLQNHPKIEKVLHPFITTNKQFSLAQKQMKPCGGLFSIQLKTNDIQKVDLFVNSLKHFLIACSWGGFESLVFPMSALYNSQNYNNNELPFNLIRLYIGFEEENLLLEDLNQALNKI